MAVVVPQQYRIGLTRCWLTAASRHDTHDNGPTKLSGREEDGSDGYGWTLHFLTKATGVDNS